MINHSTSSTWQRIAFLLIILLAILLNFGNIAIEGYANLYYAAGVYSMGQSWHAFWFNSFDPAGFVTIDKPPLGLWLQVLSTKIFGFYGWALILPQALAGVLAVALIYPLVRRSFGVNAGLVAALTLALTPISVAAQRNNTMDSVLVLVLLLAAWAVLLAAERGQLRWLLLCALLVGLGFEIKMLQAYMVLPAFYLVYFFTAQTTWRRRIAHLALASLVIAAISLAWPLAVDLTPAEHRPYVGSSNNNTVMELIFGHNGATRLGQIAGLFGASVGDAPGARTMPQGSLPPRNANPPVRPPQGNRPPGQPPAGNFAQPDNPSGQPPSGGMGNETGQTGLLRLFNRQLAGQISWFLPLSLLFIFLIPLAPRLIPVTHSPSHPITPSSSLRFTLLWAAWLVPQALFFSYAGLFHRYYLLMLAPAIAALTGAGLKRLADAWQMGGWRRLGLPLAGVVVAATQVGIVAAFTEFAIWLLPSIFLLVAMLGVVGFLFRQRKTALKGIAVLLVLTAGIAPLTWSLIPVVYGGHSGLPYAGPELLESANLTWAANDNLAGASPLADYLLANQGEAVYIVATANAQRASPLILLTGQPVMALGGFNGSDAILSVADFTQMVAQGQVRFVLAADGPPANPPAGGPGGPTNNRQPQAPQNSQSEIMQWAAQNCTPVDGLPLLDCAAK